MDDQRALTGFRVRDENTIGIITALHGVADGRIIKASSARGPILGDPLRIAKVDIRNDLALLTSNELAMLGDDGFEVAQEVDWKSIRTARLGGIKVIGYPLGLSFEDLATDLVIRAPHLKPLRNLAESAAPQLRLRNSPSLDCQVLSIQGGILPGHSGGPILDEDERVVGIANGGLRGGQVQIAWGIPFSEVEWEDADMNVELDRIKGLEVEGLFSFEEQSLAHPDALLLADESKCTFQVFHSRGPGGTATYVKPFPTSNERYVVTRLSLMDVPFRVNFGDNFLFNSEYFEPTMICVQSTDLCIIKCTQKGIAAFEQKYDKKPASLVRGGIGASVRMYGYPMLSINKTGIDTYGPSFAKGTIRTKMKLGSLYLSISDEETRNTVAWVIDDLKGNNHRGFEGAPLLATIPGRGSRINAKVGLVGMFVSSGVDFQKNALGWAIPSSLIQDALEKEPTIPLGQFPNGTLNDSAIPK